MTGMFKIIVWAFVGYFLFRVVQLVLRIMSNNNRNRTEPDPFASAPPTPPVQTFKNIEDADFEDITPKENEAKPKPPPTQSP